MYLPRRLSLLTHIPIYGSQSFPPTRQASDRSNVRAAQLLVCHVKRPKKVSPLWMERPGISASLVDASLRCYCSSSYPSTTTGGASNSSPGNQLLGRALLCRLPQESGASETRRTVSKPDRSRPRNGATFVEFETQGRRKAATQTGGKYADYFPT